KNTLTGRDAGMVENSFRGMLARLSSDEVDPGKAEAPAEAAPIEVKPTPPDSAAVPRSDSAEGPNERKKRLRTRPRLGRDATQPEGGVDTPSGTPSAVAAPASVDKSLLTLNEPRRHRDRGHLKFVASQ